MTIVHGKIESLKQVKNTLEQKGINRFQSIKEINSFLVSYENEKKKIKFQIESNFLNELEKLKQHNTQLEKDYDRLKEEKENLLQTKLEKLQLRVESFSSQNVLSILRKKILKHRIKRIERNFNSIIHHQLSSVERNINQNKLKINTLDKNQEIIISERSVSKSVEIDYIKNVIDEISPLIAGAIGENLVEKELCKLPDKYVLINDFSINFNPPIYKKQTNDRIFSIQIDHLLISNSGIFVLETKNWSKKSIENLDLRSPVKQITRASFALFVTLNSNRKTTYRKIGLNRHHWGKKQIPIRNVIVMINEKPKEKFEFVNIKRVNELNRYIEYFDPIFSDNEVNNIFEFLNGLRSTDSKCLKTLRRKC